MHASFRQLRVFLSFADTGSVSAAARANHVTQPTASIQLRELAQSIGMPLYEQIGRRLDLTDAGRDLAKTARAILTEWDAYAQRIESARGLTVGRLRVAVASTAKYFIPRLLGEFCRRYPGVDIELEIENRDGLLKRLEENRDDLTILSLPPAHLDLVQQSFLPNPLLVIAPRGHRLVRRRRVTMQELASEQLILREPGSATRRACEAHFRDHQLEPRVRMSLGSNEAIKQSVAGGLGLGILSEHALSFPADDELIAVLAVEHFPIHANWFVVYPRGKRLTPAASAFRELLEQAQAFTSNVKPKPAER
jgi:DNA-binding transcriptional LysR family regulator